MSFTTISKGHMILLGCLIDFSLGIKGTSCSLYIPIFTVKNLEERPSRSLESGT